MSLIRFHDTFLLCISENEAILPGSGWLGQRSAENRSIRVRKVDIKIRASCLNKYQSSTQAQYNLRVCRLVVWKRRIRSYNEIRNSEAEVILFL